MIEFRELIQEGLIQQTGLSVYLPYQAMSGLEPSDFPLLTVDMDFQDGIRTYNQEAVTQMVNVEVYLYAPTIDGILMNESVVQYFSQMGFTKIRESKVGKTHHWYKSYQFKAHVQKIGQDYMIS